jgi:hypothetical protein
MDPESGLRDEETDERLRERIQPEGNGGVEILDQSDCEARDRAHHRAPHPRDVDHEGDEEIGLQIVKRAIEAPLRQLADNAGQEGALIVQEVKKRKGAEGYNVATGDYEDLVKAGVVDPTKVTRSALQNAASISGLLLTTEAIVTELPEKEKTPPMPGGGMGGMGGMDY